MVKAQRFGDRTVIHNYGHGGGGISLAWGSSELAVELAGEVAADWEGRGWTGVGSGSGAAGAGPGPGPAAPGDFAVLGCGIMGLTTARLLQDRGFRVTVYARELPPDTTSNVGGGQWSPFTVFQSGSTTPEFDRQYERAARLAHRRYQLMVGPRYGVRWIENLQLGFQPRTTPRGGAIADLFHGEELYGPGEHPFEAPYLSVFSTMLIEPNTFLPAVMEDFLARGGAIRVREFRSLEEVLALEERGIINCTGIGSRALFGDDELIPIKGQLVVLLPQPEVDYILLGGASYMFPRSDGIQLGGSQERDDWSTHTTPEVVDRILEGARSIFEGMR